VQGRGLCGEHFDALVLVAVGDGLGDAEALAEAPEVRPVAKPARRNFACCQQVSTCWLPDLALLRKPQKAHLSPPERLGTVRRINRQTVIPSLTHSLPTADNGYAEK
jgi:hypothetical protein